MDTSKLLSVLKYCCHPTKIFLPLERRRMLNWLPDKMFLKWQFLASTGKRLNLKCPRTYNEKIQWLKLYDRKPEYVAMVDKYEAKKYVSALIGEEYIIPTFGVWSSFDEIDFDALPDQFVLKCTHDCGGLVICKDKQSLDMAAAREKINRALRRNYFWHAREWPYKNVCPRIIAEKYMQNKATNDLRDYKFFAFDGQVKALFIATERQSEEAETKFDFFDRDFNHLSIRNGHPNAEFCPFKPESFERMCQLAEILSKGIPHVRVDFYEVDGQIYFGELTFSHWAGMVPFDPPEWDETFGSWLTLPEKQM